MDPLAKILELDESYRQVLHSTDLVHEEIVTDVQPELRRMFADIQLEIDNLRILHPELTRKLESLYAKAHPECAITTERLIDFAYQEDLRLTGELYSGRVSSQELKKANSV